MRLMIGIFGITLDIRVLWPGDFCRFHINIFSNTDDYE